jgi:hypothetical protein
MLRSGVKVQRPIQRWLLLQYQQRHEISSPQCALMGCHRDLQQRCIMLPIQDQVARFESQRGATCKVDANTLLAFRMP